MSEIVRADNLADVAAMLGHQRFTAETLLATAFFRLRMIPQADMRFAAAHRIADELGLTEHDRAELYHFEALRAWSLQQFERAESFLDRIAPFENYRRRELEVRAWIAAGRGDLHEQLHLLDRALDVPTGDPWEIAKILQSYTNLASGLHTEYHYQRAVDFATKFHWSTDMGANRFFTYRSLAIAATFSGRAYKAVEFLCEAEHSISTTAQRCMLYVTKAWCAKLADAADSAKEYRIKALGLIDQIQWSNESDTRVCLLHLASHFYSVDEPLQGKRALDIYRAVTTKISPMFAHGLNDMRLRGYELGAFAAECFAEGNYAGARAHMTEAFSIFRTIGYRAMAIQSAIHLGNLTNKLEFWDYAAIEAKRWFPHSSCFGEKLREHQRRMGVPEFDQLHKTAQGIITGIINGLTEKQFAESLCISPNTVRNRIVELFDKFTPEKRNRAALLNALAKLGIR